MRRHPLPLPSLPAMAAAFAAAVILSSCSMVVEPETPAPAASTPRQGREARPRVEQPERLPGGSFDARPGDYRAIPVPNQLRALWVVRTTLTHPDSIRAMVDRAATAGFNTLLVQVRGRGDAYYRSRWEPRPTSLEGQDAGFDPLGLVIREAHARGLAVHAWVNAHLVGGTGSLPSDPDHLIQARPDLLAVPRELARELYGVDPETRRFAEALLQFAQDNTDRIEGLYTAPSHPEVKEHLYSVWMDLAERYELDGLHFDYIRYPNADFDYSRGALDRFREWVTPRISPARRDGLDEALRSDPLAYADSLPGPWGEFRRAQITDLVQRIYHGVKKRRPDLTVSAAVFPNAEDAYLHRFQDWQGWLAAGILDAVAPMAYTADNDVFEAQIQGAIEAGGRNRVWAGVGVYRNTYRGTIDKMRIAGSLGTRGVVLFSYDWAVSEGESEGNRTFLERVGAEGFRRR